LKQFPSVYVDSPKTLPNFATPTGKFAYKDGVGAFQGWNGGIELPKVIDLGGVRVTRPILRGRKLQQFPSVYVDSPKTLPNFATPTGKFAYKDGVGAFQGWNGGIELPKVIDLGGVRVTRPILRGRKLQQFPSVYVDSPKTLPNFATPTGKFAYKDGVGAFQGWNGGIELPKVIDLGGVRVTRPILRGH
jgi:aconitase B